MAARKIGITAVISTAVVLLASSRAVAQSNGCSSVMMTLSPCLDFISGKSPTPGISCCSLLAGVVQSDPRCLCMILDGSAASLGISINQTRALELPGVCKVQAPPVSQCTGPQGALAQTPSSDTPATEEEEEADTAAGAPSGEVIGSINVFIQALQTRVVLFQYKRKRKNNFYMLTVMEAPIVLIELFKHASPDWIVRCFAGNTTSASTNSKNTGSSMASMLIPACTLLYVF